MEELKIVPPAEETKKEIPAKETGKIVLTAKEAMETMYSMNRAQRRRWLATFDKATQKRLSAMFERYKREPVVFNA